MTSIKAARVCFATQHIFYSFVSINANYTISASFAANYSVNTSVASAKQLHQDIWTLSVSPNPVKSNVRIMFTVTKTCNYSIKLTNASGQVLSVNKITVVAGANLMELNVSNYANGKLGNEPADKVSTHLS